MEICSVTLKNFKIHADRHYEFLPGTNAICGENGAGKTSILEAIAWVLFDHSDYTRGELIRTGAKSAQATVCFISQADERVYEARRCTSRGYELHDPQLNINLGMRKLEDVQAWLREHLGVPPLTDLARLFAETIGIPQGTFTADFLKRPADRKKIFDPILKVEEYKQTYDRLRDLETYAKAQVNTLTQQLANYEQQLADWADLQQQADTLTAAIARDEAQIVQLAHQIEALQVRVDRFAAAATQVQALEGQVRQLELQMASKTEALKLLAAACLSAQKAVEVCRVRRESFHIYQTAQDALKQLSEQRRQQQTVLQQREELRRQLRDREVEVSQIQGQLATFAELRQDLAQWQALVPQQERLEQQLKQSLQALQTLEPLKLQHQAFQTQQIQHQASLDRLKTEIETLLPLADRVEQIPQLEQHRLQIQNQLSRMFAGQAFAGELQSTVEPAQAAYHRYQQQAAAAKMLLDRALPSHPDLAFLQQAIESGITLNAKILRSIQTLLQPLTDPAATASLEQQLHRIAEVLQTAQHQQQQLAVLPLKQQQYAEVQQALEMLEEQCESCDRQLAQALPLQTQVAELEAELKQLGDPKANLRLLQQQLQQAAKLQDKVARLQIGLTPMQQEMMGLETQIADFAKLDALLEEQQVLAQTHQADHQLYLRHREEANKYRELAPQQTEAEATLAALQLQVEQLQSQLQEAQQFYDPQQHLLLNANLEQLKQQNNQLQGGLAPQKSQLQDLIQRLQDRQALAEQRDRDRLILEQRRGILQFVGDARHIYNQSGPRITKYYLAEVSREADRLFRELLNRDEVTLEWTEDYEISVRERGYWRSFKSLSGGEQMCAALAVRLALLRVLANIDIAFFDEPTTNMDRQRRRQLAEAISNLKAFRQLIVISHDDTFEAVTEHVIRIER
ncbi:AAA family ATPase [Altericista sp. CCNU0014]|uniref:AAA family ATPase n=1 Tax=Altericista sp. CCNU0014 TaxID=3082949 RepID=UPI00384EA9A3